MVRLPEMNFSRTSVGESEHSISGVRKRREALMEKEKIQKVLDANKDKEFVQRIEFIKGKKPDDPSIPSIDMGKGFTGTHMMAAEVDEDGKWMVFPTIVTIDGQLQQLDANEAMHHAKSTGDFIDFGDRGDEAIAFSKDYKKVWEKEK